MSNIFTDIGHGIKVAAVDTEHAVVRAVEFLPKAISVLDDAIKNEATVKQAIIDLIQQASTVIADSTIAAGEKGIDLTADAKVLADAENFFGYFESEFIPLVEKLYAEVKQDVGDQAS